MFQVITINRLRGLLLIFLPLWIFGIGIACSQSSGLPVEGSPSGVNLPATVFARNGESPNQAGTIVPGTLPQPDLPQNTPTPDAPHPIPTMRTLEETYTVTPGDSLTGIARRYGISQQALAIANGINDPNLISPGQELIIPTPVPGDVGTAFKILPDSEFVNGPGAAGWDIDEFIRSQGGFLAGYTERVDEKLLTGVQIVDRVASENSVSPRLLLAVLEYRSGWVTQHNPDSKTRDYPILGIESWRKGLYLQLSWAANQLNLGYYRWRVNAVNNWVLADGTAVAISPLINAGTAGIQHFFAMFSNRETWNSDVSSEGFYAVYESLFGFPFSRAVEPLVPPGVRQPEMQLPFEPGVIWSFTGGPHGGWADGSAWAALDFAPPDAELGCIVSDAWVTAVASGVVVRTGVGVVMVDLDMNGPHSNDGFEQTGWVVLYMHVAERDRVQTGAYIQAGDRIGHPSCEGGYSEATHLHLARLYNGEWIPADQSLPFVLDGWVSVGTGNEYDGFLVKNGMEIEAWNAYREESTISR